ncbi:LysR family transcriptional regulator [Dyella solisilvae]|uniref:LysR family transcriptional regulator n=1 Tax=Dyella solisilvae TaxID=1920168 RepID=A0A370K2K8_9GAMM|nr:LysR family transcriptional regulator [Dyella solisilvae]RDI96828.1 LysR family transcriptional regulator [Dyella solisilvae]
MRGFDLEQLRTFAAVADAGSLSGAAPTLHLSQSSVSEQIRKLEERAGVPLFVRSKRGVSVTPAGTRLLNHARRIVALNEAAFDDLRGQAIEGELRVAITDYFRTHEVAGMLARLNECYPQLRLHMSSMKSDDIERAYHRGQLDIGVVMNMSEGPVRAARQDTRWTLRSETVSWVSSPELAGHPPSPLPLVLLPADCLLHQVAVQALDRAGIAYTMAHSATGVAGLQSMLAAGLGIGCLSASSMGEGLERVNARHRLPKLPDVIFSLLPPRQGESERVTRAREALSRQLLV